MTRIKKRSIAMIFLDGVGIGLKNPEVNPLFANEYSNFKSVFGGFLPSLRNRRNVNSRSAVIPLDANLSIKGLPQSGTGQTALFTGLNAARYIGKHFGPHPYSTLYPIIAENNLFRRLLNFKKRVYFANAYPQKFFDYINAGKRKLTVTTLSCILTNIPLHDADDLRKGKAISADITNERWPDLGYPDMPVVSPQVAGKRFARIASRNDFALFEYFLPDHAGHKQSMEFAVEVFKRLDGFIEGFIKNMTPSTTLIMTSDHGNVEDLRIKTHTRNPVPLWLYGRDISYFLNGVSTIRDITPRILSWLTKEG